MRTRGLAVALGALVILAILQVPASAGADFHKDLRPAVRGPEVRGGGGGSFGYRLEGRFTETYRNRGWVQAYGFVKVKNYGRQRLNITCTILVKTGSVVIGYDKVYLTVPGWRTKTAWWGVEGGDESGKVTGLYRCRT